MPKKRIYKVNFMSGNTLYEIYAREIAQSNLFGFIEVSDILFNTKSKVVVDPSEERLKTEFSAVNRTFIPMHTILRIDEVEKEGVAKIIPTTESGKVSTFPTALYTPTGKKPDKS